jgi:AcrR family transcriptional regulator
VSAPARTGRRPGSPATREAILAAARRCFADRGFGGATIRLVASEAGVDPALVHHYFGTKGDLFAAAVALPVQPSDRVAALMASDRAHLGEALLRTVLGVWDSEPGRDAWVGLIRSALSDDAALALLRDVLVTTIFEPVAAALDVDDAAYRVTLVASQVVGLGVARHVMGLDALATRSDEDLVAAIGPVLQRYLTGDIGAGPGSGSRSGPSGPQAGDASGRG